MLSLQIWRDHATRRRSRVKFQPEDDRRLEELVNELGTGDWHEIAIRMQNRDARQCRDRWQNYLAPGIINGPWTDEEDKQLTELVAKHGSSWREIARAFSSRTDVNVKNRWRLLERRAGKKTGHNLIGVVPYVEVPFSLPQAAQFDDPFLEPMTPFADSIFDPFGDEQWF